MFYGLDFYLDRWSICSSLVTLSKSHSISSNSSLFSSFLLCVSPMSTSSNSRDSWTRLQYVHLLSKPRQCALSLNWKRTSTTRTSISQGLDFIKLNHLILYLLEPGYERYDTCSSWWVRIKGSYTLYFRYLLNTTSLYWGWMLRF